MVRPSVGGRETDEWDSPTSAVHLNSSRLDRLQFSKGMECRRRWISAGEIPSLPSFLPLRGMGGIFPLPPAHPPPPFLFLPLFPGCPIKACVEVGGEGRRGGKNESQGEEGELSSPSSIRRSSFSRIMMREIFLIQRPCTKACGVQQ